MKTRLADKPPIYSGTRNNFDKGDHAMRTMVTAGMIATIAPRTILDPACGDASILEVTYKLRAFEMGYLYDVSQLQIDVIQPIFPHVKQQGDLFRSLEQFEYHIDMVVLTEILEHLEEPEEALKAARDKADWVVASSPIGDPEEGRNHEHLWAWDEGGYEEMLLATGWDPKAKTVLTYPGEPWNSQIWLAR